MLDTIKVGIPLSEKQHTKLSAVILESPDPQWVLFHPKTGELRFKRMRGLAEMSSPSYHRNINWDISENFTPGKTFVILELSLPKYYYGHNIRLLYQFYDVLKLLKNEVEKQLHCRFVSVNEWFIFRVDFCYAWNLGTYENAKAALESIKPLHYPRKQRHIYDTGILYSSRESSLKFYLKWPDFRKHDLQALVKANVPLDWVEHWENLSKPVLRCETTLRRQYLKRNKINTVNDLIRPSISFQLNGEWDKDEYAIYVGIKIALNNNNVNSNVNVYNNVNDGDILHQSNGRYLVVKEPNEALIIDISNLSELPAELTADAYYDSVTSSFLFLDEKQKAKNPEVTSECGAFIYEASESRSVTVRKNDTPLVILQKFLTKLLGDNRAMQDRQQVKALLEGKYKQVKASRLVGFWLFVQQFGSDEAKRSYGKESYYTAKSDLKAAGVSLTEPPIIVAGSDAEILQNFKIEVPSPRAVNLVDDNRDSENVLNLQYRRALKATRY
jgi:hypothetical protein